MKKTIRIISFLLGIILVAAGGFIWYVSPVLNGYAAKYLCSHTYTLGLDPEEAHAQYIQAMNPLFRYTTPEVDAANKLVTVTYLGFLRPRTAAWREGCGCTLLVEKSADDLRASTQVSDDQALEAPQEMGRSLCWPKGGGICRDSFSPGLDWSAIDRLMDESMAETTDDPALRTNTLGLAVAWKGHLIGERYAEGVTDSTSLLGWSAAKSVLGALYGVLVQTQGLDIRRPTGLPEWANDPRREITIDQLLRMESGLDFDEDYAGVTDATRMLYTSASMGGFAAKASAASPPDTRWSYSSGTSNILARVLYEKAGGTREALHQLMYDQFFDKLGVTTAVWEHDESGALVGSSYLYMSARDWLRVCQLYLQDGIWNGERILPEGWVAYSLTPTPNAPDARYGAHIWLNAATDPAQRQLPGLPRDLFMFKGFQGQWIIGIPSRGLVIARLGVDHDRRWPAGQFTGDLLNLLH